MDTSGLVKIIDKFSGSRVLVIGDVVVDQFIWGSVTRISPEAPVPVVNVEREEFLLGGSANVLRNIVSLGGSGGLCGLIGRDRMGEELQRLLAEIGVSSSGLVEGDRPTTVKSRVVAQGQQVVRFDREQTGDLSPEILTRFQEYLEKNLDDFDAVVVSDYVKGVVDGQLMSKLYRLLAEVRSRRKCYLPLIVDPKPIALERFLGATVITPNHHEAEQMSGIQITDDKSLLAAAGNIRTRLKCQAVLITRGEAGMALFEEDDRMVTIPTMAKEVYDVTGAGDTVAATMAMGLACGCSMRDAAVLANYAAGIVVGKVGTASVSGEELAAAVV
jgi:D-beta-D-heptose 7-phosphate kinase/D-beta-D-heptose 1-phosphate adenosyltransferase